MIYKIWSLIAESLRKKVYEVYEGILEITNQRSISRADVLAISQKTNKKNCMKKIVTTSRCKWNPMEKFRLLFFQNKYEIKK